ncbi:NADPH-dependent FMN reductase-like protein, partial [Limtongia smithiae]|uniref:NADPH-dependent FMN reductase-like protein n=1 Tax=Limtongia smithiae TaxID=1125753 RepID=UPI0034CFAD3F
AVKPLVYIIISTTRVTRVGPDIAKWLLTHLTSYTTATSFKIIDLRDYDLPLHSIEPEIPMTGKYSQPGTIEWSKTIAAADGYIFVTPIYNGSFPAPLKNALDYLKKEWFGKPCAIASYSRLGLDTAAKQLAHVLKNSLRMDLVE